MTLRSRLAVSMLAIGLALPALANHGEHQAVSYELKGWALAPFALTDQHGRKFTQDKLLSRWTFVVLGDTTNCPRQPCGAALTVLAGLSQRIARTEVMKTTQILFISLDSQRDTPTRLREYLSGFGNHVVGATAAPKILQGLIDDLGVGSGVMMPVGTGDAAPPYRGTVFLIGPDATIRAEYLPPLDMLRLTSAYLRTRISGR